MSFESLMMRMSSLADFLVEALFEDHVLLGGGQVRDGIFDFDAAQVDAALGQAQLQDLQHLLELEIDFGLEFDREFLELEYRAGVLEVEALTELAVGLVDGVGDFVGVELGGRCRRRALLGPRAR